MVLNLKHFGHQLVSSRLKLLLESVCLSVSLSLSLSPKGDGEKCEKSEKERRLRGHTVIYVHSGQFQFTRPFSCAHNTRNLGHSFPDI